MPVSTVSIAVHAGCRGAVEHVSERRQSGHGDDGNGGDEGVIGERVVPRRVGERGADDEYRRAEARPRALVLDTMFAGEHRTVTS